MNSVFKECYGQEGGRERMTGLVAQNQKSRTAALQEMNIHAMARRDSLPSKLQPAGPEID